MPHQGSRTIDGAPLFAWSPPSVGQGPHALPPLTLHPQGVCDATSKKCPNLYCGIKATPGTAQSEGAPLDTTWTVDPITGQCSTVANAVSTWCLQSSADGTQAGCVTAGQNETCMGFWTSLEDCMAQGFSAPGSGPQPGPPHPAKCQPCPGGQNAQCCPVAAGTEGSFGSEGTCCQNCMYSFICDGTGSTTLVEGSPPNSWATSTEATCWSCNGPNCDPVAKRHQGYVHRQDLWQPVCHLLPMRSAGVGASGHHHHQHRHDRSFPSQVLDVQAWFNGDKVQPNSRLCNNGQSCSTRPVQFICQLPVLHVRWQWFLRSSGWRSHGWQFNPCLQWKPLFGQAVGVWRPGEPCGKERWCGQGGLPVLAVWRDIWHGVCAGACRPNQWSVCDSKRVCLHQLWW